MNKNKVSRSNKACYLLTKLRYLTKWYGRPLVWWCCGAGQNANSMLVLALVLITISLGLSPRCSGMVTCWHLWLIEVIDRLMNGFNILLVQGLSSLLRASLLFDLGLLKLIGDEVELPIMSSLHFAIIVQVLKTLHPLLPGLSLLCLLLKLGF